MNALRNIVVGLDFTPASRTALRQAARMAAWNDAALHAVHVVESSWIDDLASVLGIDRDRFAREVEERSRKAAQDVAAEGEPASSARVDVAVGSTVDMLMRSVKTAGADLLVLGVRSPVSEGRGPGPVAAACLRRTRTKVLLAREDHRGPYKTVVACTDFSDTSFRALQMAVRVAQQDKSAVRIVHVAIPPKLDMAYAGHPLGMWPGQPLKVMEMWNTYRAALDPRLEKFVEPLRHEMVALNVTLDVVEHDHYGRGIAAYAREHNADLLVLGTQGRTNLRYALLGSTAERVLNDLPCSALTVKPAEFAMDID
jgi:nucleotide-binding universal stress UspA family protein